MKSQVLITGADGFIGRNLRAHLAERVDVEVVPVVRGSSREELQRLCAEADFLFHLAGVNRPQSPSEFDENRAFTAAVCAAIQAAGKRVPVVFTSSIQAQSGNPYGASKRNAEQILIECHERFGLPVHICRLPNVFGKWSRPNYNSGVATFCYNVARDLPIRIDDDTAPLSLVYIDDVIETFISVLEREPEHELFFEVTPVYHTTVGAVAHQIRAFRASRETLITEPVGSGFLRALHATYISYLPNDRIGYAVPRFGDARGDFVEMLKTRDSGQISYFTAGPGVSRGGHYHHSKTEKFLVVRGKAKFRFRNISTGEYHELTTSGADPEIVETMPGWAHDITNVGDVELIVMLWANELFDRDRPDTIHYRMQS